MFDIIIPELEKRGIEYSMLTGQTKVDTRIEMVDEFNKDENIKVFLISLKAGGTGLNLTGADMVIHYDPWWNLSAQNQATDRAYRIGQRNNVQVFKLISENSIEEKIQKLQDKKQNLTDSVIKSGETASGPFIQRPLEVVQPGTFACKLPLVSIIKYPLPFPSLDTYSSTPSASKSK